MGVNLVNKTLVILGTLTQWLDVPPQIGLQIHGAMMKTIMPNATILMAELVVTMTIQLGMTIVLIVNAFNKNFCSSQTKKYLIDFRLTMYLKKKPL